MQSPVTFYAESLYNYIIMLADTAVVCLINKNK